MKMVYMEKEPDEDWENLEELFEEEVIALKEKFEKKGLEHMKLTITW